MTSALFDSGRSAPAGFGTRREILGTISARSELVAAVLVNMGDLMCVQYRTRKGTHYLPQDNPKCWQVYTKLHGIITHTTVVVSMLFICKVTSLTVTIED